MKNYIIIFKNIVDLNINNAQIIIQIQGKEFLKICFKLKQKFKKMVLKLLKSIKKLKFLILI